MAAHDALPFPSPSPRPQAALPAPTLAATPDAFALLKALRRRWFLAGTLGAALACVTAAAVYVLLPARYTGFQMLQAFSKGNDLHSQENRTEFDIFIKTSAHRIKSRDVLMRALNQDAVRNLRLIKKHPDTLSALTWLEENLQVATQAQNELLTVSLSGEEPNDLVVLVNAINKAALSIMNQQERGQRKDHLDRVKLLYEGAQEGLKSKVSARDAILKKQGHKDGFSLAQQHFMLQAQLQGAQQRLQMHQYELEKKNAQLANYKNFKQAVEAGPGPEVASRDVQDADPSLKQMTAEAAKYQAIAQRCRDAADPQYHDYEARRDAVQTKIDARVAELKAAAREKVKAKQETDLGFGAAGLETEIGPLDNLVRQIKAEVADLTGKVESASYWNSKSNLLDSEIGQMEKNVAGLFDAFKRAEVVADMEPRIIPIGEAELQPRDAKKRLFLVAVAPLGVLLVVILAVAWWEFAARRISDTEEVVANLALRVVGAVPELPDPRRQKAGDPEAEEVVRHNLIESIDAIRTMLLRSANAENLRVVMVTSAVGGEGKTTLASNLAMSLARAGRKTLLIDCDLRRPAAHQLFEQTLQPGFSEVALNEVDLPDAVRPTTTDPNLFLLPAGLWDREVLQELAKTGVTSIFERLREQFDFVIVDSHPVLPATDSLLIGQHVDAVIVSLMREVSQMHHVQSATTQLATLGIRVYGAVVNGVPVKVYGKSYQYTAPTPVATAERAA